MYIMSKAYTHTNALTVVDDAFDDHYYFWAHDADVLFQFK